MTPPVRTVSPNIPATVHRDGREETVNKVSPILHPLSACRTENGAFLLYDSSIMCSIMSFRIDRCGQVVQIQIRLINILLKHYSKVRSDCSKILVCPKIQRNFNMLSPPCSYLSLVVRKLVFGRCLTRSDTNRAVQLQKMARGLKFRI